MAMAHAIKEGKYRKRKQKGAGKIKNAIADLAEQAVSNAAKAALASAIGSSAAGPGSAALAGMVLGMAAKKAIKADYTQSKRREFNKAYKPMKNPRTGKKPNWFTGGWYSKRKNPSKNRYQEDYGFGTW